jgi:hypothetical protein
MTKSAPHGSCVKDKTRGGMVPRASDGATVPPPERSSITTIDPSSTYIERASRHVMPATIFVVRAITFVDPAMRLVDAVSIHLDPRSIFIDVGT